MNGSHTRTRETNSLLHSTLRARPRISIAISTPSSFAVCRKAMAYNVGVLTISDSASVDPTKDKSGPLLESLLQSTVDQHLLNVKHRSICRDDIDEIRRCITAWTSNKQDIVHLVLCTGGTGLGLRDVTPEAVGPLLIKETPGITHALMRHSLQKTPLAALSRLITGITPNNRLIITLPGSSRAVEQCCEVLLGSDGLLLHALDLLNGGSGSEKHAQMHGASAAADDHNHHNNHRHHHDHNRNHDSHHHHAHHGHHHSGHLPPKPRTEQHEQNYRTHDPSQAVTLRHRTSPYPIIPLEEALNIILDTVQVNETITLSTSAQLRGHLLAEAIHAPRSLPPRPTSNVDGYAVKAASTPVGAYFVEKRGGTLGKGQVYRINTGQALPEGSDAVLMVEDTDLIREKDGEEVEIQVKAQIDIGENVRQAGSDVGQGVEVLAKGVALSDIGGEIGTLAFLGLQYVKVIRKPRIAILSTGDELYDVTSAAQDDHDRWGFRIFDANRPSLIAALQSAGFEVVDLGIARDDVEQTLTALNRGIEEADVLITTGGTSMGESDLLKPLLERHVRAGKILFGRVAMKPGKPTTFGTAESSHGERRLVFALPGNPASAMVCLYVFVMPALRRMSGYDVQHAHLPRINVCLQNAMRCDPRPEFHRVSIRSYNCQLHAHSTGGQRSSGMPSMSTANGLVCVPALTAEGPKQLDKGTMAQAILLGNVV